MKSITIHVIDRDIRLGQPKNSCNCPISRAVLRRLKLRRGQVVISDIASVHCGGKFYTSRLPEVAHDFIRKFDIGKPVEPLDFTLELPDDFPLPVEAA